MPPDVNRSEFKCAIIDGRISLGLSVIANVGKGAESIIEARRSGGAFSGIYDLCRRTDLRLVNKKTLESLIMAGALDSLPGTRAQLFAAIERALEFGNTFQQDRLMGQTNLFSLDSSSEGETHEHTAIPEPDLPDVAPWPYNELLAREKEVLNFYMSGHPLDHYRDEVKGLTTHTLKESALAELREGTSVLIGGIITSVKVITQRNGKNMAFLTLEDFDGSIELIVFADAFAQYGNWCAVDSMVLVRGTLQKREGEHLFKVCVDKIMALSEAREKLARSVHLRMRTQGLEEEFVREIREHCAQHSGACSLVIHLITQDGNEHCVCAGNLRIQPEQKVIDMLRSKLGQENVWLSQRAA
jgi:DNA polymerase-3 subunit alpha